MSGVTRLGLILLASVLVLSSLAKVPRDPDPLPTIKVVIDVGHKWAFISFRNFPFPLSSFLKDINVTFSKGCQGYIKMPVIGKVKVEVEIINGTKGQDAKVP